MLDHLKEERDLFYDAMRQNGILLSALDTIADMAVKAGNAEIVTYVGDILEQLSGADALKKLN